MRLARHLVPALLAWLALLCSAGASAQGLPGFSHTGRTLNDGAPADVWTLATPDPGTLWLGTGQGLYRFDGVRFERYPLRGGQQLPSSNINALAVLPGGDIWLGLFNGGVVRLRDGIATHHGPAQGMPGGRVLRFATASGALWAAAAEGLARYDGQRWQRVGADWSYPAAGADYLFTDSRGVLWVAAPDRLYQLKPGERQFRPTGERVSRTAVLAEDRSGRLWLSDDWQGTRPLPDPSPDAGRASDRPAPAGPAGPAVFARAKQMLFARDGSLWLTELGVGVLRLAQPERVPSGRALAPADGLQRFTRQDGLASNVAVPLVEDADGEVWVGTNRGLASFRPRRLQAVPELADAADQGLSLALLDGGVLAGNRLRALQLDPPGPARPWPQPLPVEAAVRAPDGALWRVDAAGVWRDGPGAPQRLPLAPEAALSALAPDAQGGAWLSVQGAGVFHATPGRLRREPRAEAGGAGPGAITVAADGWAWFGHDNLVIGLAGDQRQRIGPEHGLAVGRVTLLLATRHGLLVAGEAGLARWDGRRAVTIPADRDDAFGHVSGAVEAADGDLWLNGARGVLRLPAADVGALFARPGAPLNHRLFNEHDGLPGIALQARPVPTALQDARGRLWFATNQGLAWLDPAVARRPARVPQVQVQQLRTADQAWAATPGMVLPPGTRQLAFRYGAQVLAAAERVRFRYRLVGVHDDWREAGHQREAFYPNLGPGDYRFEVLAAGADGVWGAQASGLDFSIRPTLVQSRPFLLGCVLLGLALAWAAYLLRTRALAAALRLRLDERHAERERIARELHDTLLQGFQGLVLSFHAAAERLTDPVLQQRLRQALARAEQTLVEGRDRVRELRQATPSGATLAEALAEAGQALVLPPTSFRLDVVGEPRALSPLVVDEVLMVAREALANAAQHAQAGSLLLELAFHHDALRLRIRDDGVGMDPAVQAQGHREGRYGLRGMAERARQLGGELAVFARPGQGTEVALRVPAARAYRAAPRQGTGGGWLQWWRGRRA